MALYYKCSQGEADTNDCSCRDVNTKWQRNSLSIAASIYVYITDLKITDKIKKISNTLEWSTSKLYFF